MRKVLLVANTSWYLYNFRRPLARALRERGVQPVLLAPKDAYSERLLQEGFQWQELDVPKNRLNPWREFKSFLGFIAAYRREKPVAAHHFTIKCVIYGTLAARITGVPRQINAVTGLGHVFLSKSWKATLLRGPLTLAYRFVLGSEASRVIFQNPDDRKTFVDAGLVDTRHTVLIRSSGVDISRFTPKAGPLQEPGIHVLFASRLLREKGIFELIEAIRLLKAQPKNTDITFSIAGDISAGNPSAITQSQIEQWRKEGLARFVGHVDSVHDLIATSDLVVLPSYREGTPRILLEACAMEKAVVTTDVPGCREVVEHERNGLLVPSHDSQALAAAIERLAHDAPLRETMGKLGRRKVLAEFSDVEIARQTLTVYEELGIISA